MSEEANPIQKMWEIYFKLDEDITYKMHNLRTVEDAILSATIHSDDERPNSWYFTLGQTISEIEQLHKTAFDEMRQIKVIQDLLDPDNDLPRFTKNL